MSLLSKQTRVRRLLQSKESRDAYVLENIRRIVPFQIRTMREERDWSQAQAGEAMGKPQNVISRLESLAYGKLNLQTLIEVAHGYDVGLLIKFVPFSRLVREYEDLSPAALSAKSVSESEERTKLEAWSSISTSSYDATPQVFFTVALPSRRENILARSSFAQTAPNVAITTQGRGEIQPEVSGQVADLTFYKRVVRPLNQRKFDNKPIPTRRRKEKAYGR